MTGSALAWLGRTSIDGRVGRALAPLSRLMLGRPFPASSRLRVQIYYTRSRICFSQVYPFLHHESELGRRYGADIRYFDIERLLQGQLSPVGADIVMVQPWFTVDRAVLTAALDRVRAANPQARVIFLDSYAHNDLRLARSVEPFIDLYVKKSLFRDRACYFRQTLGDTNLTDFYGQRHGCAQPQVNWDVPPSILPKLRCGPGFFTAPGLIEGFLGAPPDMDAERPIDLHARLAVGGGGWYARMRTECQTRAEALEARVVTGSGVPRARFMEELRRAKLVFSPFGYGELCWRDVEGFLTGAVVVKQDMGHLETCPDLYRPWETYVPVAWDLSDLEANVARVLADPPLLRRMAERAWTLTHRYLVEGGFVTDAGHLLRWDLADRAPVRARVASAPASPDRRAPAAPARTAHNAAEAVGDC